MVKIVETYHDPNDGSIIGSAWLDHVKANVPPQDYELIRQTYLLSELSGSDHATYTGESCHQQGLAIAEILVSLQLDANTIAAGLIYPCVQYAELTLEDVEEQLDNSVTKLVDGVAKMDAIRILHQQSSHMHHSLSQIDNLRKMLLAMVEDVRVVLIKLAERTITMRAIKIMDARQQEALAREIRDLYAPLANRLGIGQIKWELEDLAFRYLQPDIYKQIAKSVDKKRTDRQIYIKNIISIITEAIQKAGIHKFEVNGRAKHIYSIYRKMQRKKVDFSQIYDANAVRVLVNSLEECYAVLGIVHSLWTSIPEEFDDYITHPKPNGYRSLHTAVKGPEDHNLEIQIRTYDMHQESELGVAAHWLYKEGGGDLSGYEQKIAWLRQVIDWQKELTSDQEQLDNPEAKIFDDRVYVFTPTGQIIDLPTGATSLDFAYLIHTEVGHRCRGAKINGKIVPLTQKLSTGDRVEILTAKQASPSRDWLNPNLGYLRSSRARAKVHHWFKQQDYDQHVELGHDMLDKEIKRLHLDNVPLHQIVPRFNKKSLQDLYASLGAGDLKLGQIIHHLEEMHHAPKKAEEEHEPELKIVKPTPQRSDTSKGIKIYGVGNLLTHIANCCKPVPGDPIIGFITQGRGVSIHRQDCNNILSTLEHQQQRLIEVNWGDQPSTYPVDLIITAYDRHGLIRDITNLLANEKINMLALNTSFNRSENIAEIQLTIEIPDLNQLSRLFDRINQLSNLIDVSRRKQ